MVRVYIASPYSLGNKEENVKKSLVVAHELLDMGLAPFTPLLTHYWDLIHTRPYEDWLKLDLEWVSVCDCILRLPGESSGADREVEFAKANGIRVFYSIDELKKFYII